MADNIEERTEAPVEGCDDKAPAGAEQSPQKTKHKLGGKAIAAIVCAALAAFFGLVTLILRDPFTLILTVIMLIPVIVLVIMIAHEKYKERHPEYSFLPYWGIIAEAACMPLALLATFAIAWSIFILPLFILLVCAVLVLPLLGMATGIATLAQGRKKCNTGGFVTAIIDITLPPLAVAIVILLFSLDVIVITLM